AVGAGVRDAGAEGAEGVREFADGAFAHAGVAVDGDGGAGEEGGGREEAGGGPGVVQEEVGRAVDGEAGVDAGDAEGVVEVGVGGGGWRGGGGGGGAGWGWGGSGGARSWSRAARRRWASSASGGAWGGVGVPSARAARRGGRLVRLLEPGGRRVRWKGWARVG